MRCTHRPCGVGFGRSSCLTNHSAESVRSTESVCVPLMSITSRRMVETGSCSRTKATCNRSVMHAIRPKPYAKRGKTGCFCTGDFQRPRAGICAPVRTRAGRKPLAFGMLPGVKKFRISAPQDRAPPQREKISQNRRMNTERRNCLGQTIEACKCDQDGKIRSSNKC